MRFENILKGQNLIMGRRLCYHNGFFFEFAFPNNYPWAPPKVIYRTNDGTTEIQSPICIVTVKCVYRCLIHGKESHGLLVSP